MRVFRGIMCFFFLLIHIVLNDSTSNHVGKLLQAYTPNQHISFFLSQSNCQCCRLISLGPSLSHTCHLTTSGNVYHCSYFFHSITSPSSLSLYPIPSEGLKSVFIGLSHVRLYLHKNHRNRNTVNTVLYRLKMLL